MLVWLIALVACLAMTGCVVVLVACMSDTPSSCPYLSYAILSKVCRVTWRLHSTRNCLDVVTITAS